MVYVVWVGAISSFFVRVGWIRGPSAVKMASNTKLRTKFIPVVSLMENKKGMEPEKISMVCAGNPLKKCNARVP